VSDNRILYYDPNRPDNKGVPLEDLSISVELTATKKSRSLIVEGTLVNLGGFKNGISDETVSFISGSRLSDNPKDQPSLTTRYTNVGFGDDNLEGFGITEINIDFNTSYAPVIKINFVDVRGGIIARGNESKYRIFFDLPYPLFNLTVKGYYGKAVSYCLHMVKWNALFNSDTGNYEIEAEFIGYTYAMLTDILVGYMKAIPYTEIGGEKFVEIQQEFLDTLGTRIFTMDEIIQKTEEVNELVQKYSPLQDEYKKLISLKKVNELLSDIDSLRAKLINDVKKKLGRDPLINVDTVIYYQTPTNNEIETNLIKNYNNEVSGKLDELNTLVDILPFKKHFTPRKIDNINLSEFKGSETIPFIQTDGNTTIQKKEYLNNQCGDDKYDLTVNTDNSRLTELVTALSNLEAIPQPSPNLVIFDFRRTSLKINDIKTLNEKINAEEKSKLSNKLRDKSKELLDFDPTINTIFLSLCAHAEAFMESVAHVATASQKNDERIESLKTLFSSEGSTNIKRDVVESGVIYPFPEYYENGTEKWMGNIVSPNSVDELYFTKDLLKALVESKRRELESLELNNIREDWYAMSPIETPLMGNTTNPYRVVGKVRHYDELLRILMYRSFLYLSVYRPEMTDEEVRVMGIFEALNLFYGNADGIAYGSSDNTIRQLLNEFFKTDGSIIQHFETGSNRIKNFSLKAADDVEPTPYMKSVGNNYEYSYISEFKNNKLRQYIPVTDDGTGNSFNGRNFGEISGVLKPNADIKTISSIYVSNDRNNVGVDDGTRYLTILPYNRYENSGFAKPINREFDSELYNENNSKFGGAYPTHESVINSGRKDTDTIGNIKLDSIQTKFGTSEFIQYSDNSDVRKSFFIDNTPTKTLIDAGQFRGTTIKTIGDDNSIGKTFNSIIKNDSNSYIDNPSFTYSYFKDQKPQFKQISLFGSPLYYTQDSIESKAYLFLSTLPIQGMYGNGGDNGNTLFNNKDTEALSGLFVGNGGLIKAPSVWIYWVGSILWRYYETSDPIKRLPTPFNSIPKNAAFPSRSEIFRTITKPIYTVSEEESRKRGFHLSSDQFHATFKKVDQTLIDLPVQVRNEFITAFKTFADSSRFRSIDESLSIFTSSDISNFTNDQSLNQTTVNNIISKGLDVEYFTGSTFNLSETTSTSDNYYTYNIKFDINTDAGKSKANDIFKLMTESSIIVNATPRIFKKGVSERLSIPKGKLETFLNTVASTYRDLYEKTEEKLGDEKKILGSIFGNDNNEDILLSIYRHLTAVNDKWVGGDNRQNGIFFPCKFNERNKEYRGGGGKNRLFDSFRFINKAFLDIGNEFLINPKTVSDLITNKYNQSFFDLISRILSGNNMDFIPLPAFVDFTNEKGIEDIFRPITYNQLVNDSDNLTIGPSFICVYVGQHSTSLNISDSDYPDDGADLKNSTKLICEDWTSDSADPNTHRMNIPVFEVNYAQQNQSYFKAFKPDQREFVETQESLEIIDSLSRTGDKNKVTFAGQNLFNIYQKRSYSVEIEALGMPLIQPMMYFQLNDVPIFRGAYLIINTKHHIKPNHMTTKFKGVRVKNTCTPLTKEFYLIKDLVLDLDVDGVGGKYELIDPTIATRRTRSDGSTVYEGNIPLGEKGPNEAIYDKAYIKRRTVLNQNPNHLNNLLSRESNTSRNGVLMQYRDIFSDVSNNLSVPMDTVSTMAYIESSIGKNKGNILIDGVGQMNASGFVGVMQFGLQASTDVRTEVANYIFNKITRSEYTFYSQLDETNKRLKIPNPWQQSATTNNKTTNSMFDDYINTVAGVYYGFLNIGQDAVADRRNVVDMYLSHQQGRGGLKYIKTNKDLQISDGDGVISGNVNNNPPPYPATAKNEIKTFGDWYSAWKGSIDAIMDSLSEVA